MAEVASAFVSIAPSARGFGAKLGRQVGPGLEKSGKDVGHRFGAAVKLGAIGAAVGAGAFLKGAIGDASDLNESQSKVGVVFGKSAASIVKASKTSAAAMGLSQNAYLGATGTLGNLLVSLNIAPKSAAKLSKKMVKLAGDMASFNNVSPEEALAALQSGLTGETEPLKKFGVNMNEATLKAEALALGLLKPVKDQAKITAGLGKITIAQAVYTKAVKDHGAKSIEALKAQGALTASQAALEKATTGTIPPLTAQQKALAAQALIMKQTKTAQGDFARTSSGLANQQRILAAKFKDIKTKIGGVLLPAFLSAVTFIDNRVLPAFTKLGGYAKTAKDKLVGAFEDLKLGGLLTAVTGAFDGVDWTKIGTTITTAFDGIDFSGIGAAISAGISGIDISGLAVNLATQAQGWAQPIIEGFKAGLDTGDWSGLGTAIGNGVIGAIKGLSDLAGKIGTVLGDLLAKVDWVGIGIAIGKQAPSLLVGLSVGLLNFDLLGLLKGLATHWQDILLAVIAVAFLPAKIAGKVAEVLARIPLAGRLLSWAFLAFKKLSDSLVRMVGKALGFLGRAFLTGFRRVFPAVGRSFAQALSILPTRLGLMALAVREKAVALVRGIGNGIASGIGGVVAKIGELIAKMLRPFAKAGGWLVSKGVALLRGLGRGIGSAIAPVLRVLKGIGGKVLTAVGDLGIVLYKAGKSIIQGLIDGITAKLSALGTKLSAVGTFIKDHKGPPSKDAVMLRPAGKLIMGGLITGITEKESDLKSTLRGVSNRIQLDAPALDPSVSGATTGTSRGGHSGPIFQVDKVEAQDVNHFLREMQSRGRAVSGGGVAFG